MPALAYWFSGPAIAAFLVFVGAGYGWYMAANSEQEKAQRADREKVANDTATRSAVLASLTREYILSHDGLSPGLLAGTEQPPADWINKRLQELGHTWRVSP